eukprot:gene18472-13292_t
MLSSNPAFNCVIRHQDLLKFHPSTGDIANDILHAKSVRMPTVANGSHNDDVPDVAVRKPDNSVLDRLVDDMVVDGDNGELSEAAVVQYLMEWYTLSASNQFPPVATQSFPMVPPNESTLDVGGSGAPLSNTPAAATSTDDHPNPASLPACDGPIGAEATAPDMHGTDDHSLIPPAFPTRRASKRAGSRGSTGRAHKGAAPTPSSQLLMVKEFKRSNGEPLTLAALSTIHQKTEILRMPKTKLLFEILSGFLPLPTGSPEQALNDLRRRDGFNELLRKIATCGEFFLGSFAQSPVEPWTGIATTAKGAGVVGVYTENLQSGLYGSTDYGQSWVSSFQVKSLSTLTPGGGAANAVNNATGSYQAVAMHNQNLFYTTNHWKGGWWYISGWYAWKDVAISSSGQLFVGLIDGQGFYYSTNYGATWQQLPSASYQLNSVSLNSDGNWILTTASQGYAYVVKDVMTSSP